MVTPNRNYLAIGILFVAYAALRIWRLTDSCLWFDEIFSVHAAEHSWGALLQFVAQDLVHPPLFYVLLKAWIGAGGEGLFWLRLLPVSISLLAFVPFYFLCRELKISSYALMLAGAFLAVNGALIKYSQTLRMYSLLMFLSLLSIWLFARYFNRGKNWIWLTLVNVLLIYTHYFGWLVVGSEVLAILLFQRIKFGRAALMTAILCASFVPWVFAILSVDRTGSDLAQNIAWQTRPGLGEIVGFLLHLAEPFYSQTSNAQPVSILYVSLPILLLGIIATAMFLASEKSEDDLAAFRLLNVFAIFPLAVTFVLSWVMQHSVWGARHLVFIIPIMLTMAAIAILGVPERRISLGIIVLISALTAVGSWHEVIRPSPNYVWCAWEGIAKEIVEIDGPNAASQIYTFESLAAYHLWFALRNDDGPSVRLINGVDVRTNDEMYFLPRGFKGVGSIRVEEIDSDEFWLVFRTFRLGEEFPLMEIFTRMGYSLCPPRQTLFETNNVFRMKFVRHAQACPVPH